MSEKTDATDDAAAEKGSDNPSGLVLDKELTVYRNLLQTPTEFRNGFTWITVAGALFCGLLMFPGAIYLGLLSGMGMNAAATWVTVIVFSEITRRALRSMSKEEMVILLSVASGMIAGGGPFADLIYRQFLIGSDAVKDAGLYGKFPAWWAPPPDSAALLTRTFLHSDWAIPILLMLFMTVLGFVKTYTLGYAIFRLTSDVEKLPFPMSPVGAQGVMALAEENQQEQDGGKKKGERWTVFSIGTMIGLCFGVISVGVPAISSAFLQKPIMIIPIPWFDLCRVTEKVLPATSTGIIFDLGMILVGMVIPFWAVVGSTFSVVMTFVLNPILFHAGILTSWRPGMDTINTQISNSIDFYFSAGLGMAIGIAVCSVYQTVKQLRASLKNSRAQNAARLQGTRKRSMWDVPKGRGDWSLKLCLVGYILAATSLIVVTKMLVPGFKIYFLVIFAFVYVPLTSYLDARIMGIAGTYASIPFVREAFILFSGVKGVSPWLVPLPIESFGGMAGSLRTVELTGVRFTSHIKAWALVTPLLFILSFAFWSFIWKDGPIPSDLYPYAQKMWDLQARNTMIMWSATTEAAGESLFQRSFRPEYLTAGFLFTTIMFTSLSALGMPTMLVYGMARGLGSIPHGLILELIGALIGKFYFQRRFGRERFLRWAPILLAGYGVGIGLIGMGAVAIRLIASAVTTTPF